MPLEQMIAQLLILGFQGTTPDFIKDGLLPQQIKQGLGGVILFNYNIENSNQLKTLNANLSSLPTPDGLPLLICVDQEGGKVQRLSAIKGFPQFLSPQKVAELPQFEAMNTYEPMAKLLKNHGFNQNFGTCVDKNPDSGEPCSIIGGLGRSFGNDPEVIAKYASIMIEASRRHGVGGCIKHFPGHGSAHGDTHAGLVDVSKYWTPSELESFRKVIQEKQGVEMIMTAHIVNTQLDPEGCPATFSKPILNQLREWGFEGIIISDDLHMSAIGLNYGFEEAVIRALAAGNDMVIFSNNPAAAAGNSAFKADPDLPEKFINAVKKGLQERKLQEEQICKSFERVQILKRNLGRKQTLDPFNTETWS